MASQYEAMGAAVNALQGIANVLSGKTKVEIDRNSYSNMWTVVVKPND